MSRQSNTAMEFNINNLVRENIKRLKPYATARHEFSGEATVFLDANENAWGSPLATDSHAALNRYPDPLQVKLKQRISQVKGAAPSHIFLGNGSDEPIDLLFRVFCEPVRDNVIICPPAYGMYEVCAGINDVNVKKVNLLPDYQLDLEGIAGAIDDFTKLIFICSPNNPTGNSMNRNDIELLLNNFDGLVIIDEAYINFSRHRSFIPELREYPNLVVLQTFSKAWGLAGLRLGMAFAGENIIQYLNKVKYPYNIGSHTQEMALAALDKIEQVNRWTRETVKQKEAFSQALLQLPMVEKVYPSDANFVLVKMRQADKVFDYLARQGIIVRNRSSVVLCEDSLRITVGTVEENNLLLKALQNYTL